MEAPDLPSSGLIRAQAAWLKPARDWLLGEVGLGGMQRVLDLGAGYGAVTRELMPGPGGRVAALDKNHRALRESPDLFGPALRMCGDAAQLCFRANTFDLVFTQLVLLWVPLEPVLREIARVTASGGVLVAVEPDYGGLIEHPETVAVRDIWVRALLRAGADPYVGRKLPGLLDALGYQVRVNLFNELVPPSSSRFDLLRELELTPEEVAAVDQSEKAAGESGRGWSQIAHLPFMLITARLG